MRTFLFLGAIYVLLAATPTLPTAAQQHPNDGFQRRNGQMHVLRNGQLRPLTRDAHLPSGAVVTKDGFVVSRQGKRTELREGQGCDLKGNVVAVVPATTGGLALASPAAASRRAAPAGSPGRMVLEDLFGREQREKEEWRREEHKRHHGFGRGRGKKPKGKGKKGKKWDE